MRSDASNGTNLFFHSFFSLSFGFTVKAPSIRKVIAFHSAWFEGIFMDLEKEAAVPHQKMSIKETQSMTSPALGRIHVNADHLC